MFAAAYADKEIGPRLKIKMEQDVATSVLTLDSAAAADDEEPLLFQAARAGQHGNVKFILAQSGSDMRDAVWARNPETGELLIREMLATLTSADHLQVGYLVEDYLAANAPPPPPA